MADDADFERVVSARATGDAALYDSAVLQFMDEYARNAQFIFVGGAARSGTTFLRHILNAHSRISCGHEMKLIPVMCSTRRKWWGSMSGQLQAAGMPQAHLDVAFRVFVAVYMLLSRVGDKPRIAEKTPHNVTEFGQLAAWFPRAKFVHVVRDGRAVVASLLKQRWVDLLAPEQKLVWYCRTAANAALYWRQILEAADEHRDAIAPPNFHELRYEQLVRAPEHTLRRLFDFLNEPWEPHVLAANPVDASAEQRWRGDLTPAQLREIDKVAGARLRAMGYQE